MQSVSLWCDYLNFIQVHDPSVRECSPDGISKARNLFERALTAAGLHVAEGNKIWELYREFEQAVLHTIDENDIKVGINCLYPVSCLFCLHVISKVLISLAAKIFICILWIFFFSFV
jgi:hypothetical protein